MCFVLLSDTNKNENNTALYFFLLSPFFAKAQRNDNIWPLSYTSFPINIYYNLNFSNGNPDTVLYQRTMSISLTSAAISDSSGNLLFCTNGQWIANKNFVFDGVSFTLV